MRKLTIIRLPMYAKINDQWVEDVGFSLHQFHAKFVTCLQLPVQPAGKAAFISFRVCFLENEKFISAQNFKEGDIQNQIIYTNTVFFFFMNWAINLQGNL